MKLFGFILLLVLISTTVHAKIYTCGGGTRGTLPEVSPLP